MKILVISLAGIGDTLMTTPLIHELRENYPSATIDALVMWPGARDALEGNPHLNKILQKNLIKSGIWESLRFLNGLRRFNYDISINTHPQSRIHYRIVARTINAGVRVSHAYDQSGFLDRCLVNKLLKQNYALHSADNNLALLPSFGAKQLLPTHEYELFINSAEKDWADAWLDKNDLSKSTKVGIHVGSGGTKNLALRRWPLSHYVTLIRKLNQSHPNLSILLFGGPEEAKDHASVLAETEGKGLVIPKTENLRQAAALIGKCDLFLSVDTALMHVAAAMKVPRQIVIETPTLNPTIVPYRRSFETVPNPMVGGRGLEFYRYDGRGIRGTADEIKRSMESVGVDAVYERIVKSLNAITL